MMSKKSDNIGSSRIPIHTDQAALYVAVLLGAFLRIYKLGYQSIWGDEALTIQKYAVGGTLSEMLANVWNQGFHPPGYFVVVHFWSQLGDSEFMLRFPSAVFGIASIPILYLLVKRLFGTTAGIVSAFMIALSPFHIWYSQEARMYSLVILLALGSMLLFLRASETRRPVDYAAYWMLTVLGLFTHVAFMLVIMSQGFYTLGIAVRDWRRYIPWIGIQALAVLAFLPWIIRVTLGRSGSTGVIGFEREASPLHLAYGLYTFAVGYSLGPTVSGLHYLSPMDALRPHMAVIVLTTIVVGVLMVLGLVRGWRSERKSFWFVLCHLAVPLVLTSAAAFVPGIPLNPRYLISASIPFWIFTGLGVLVCLRGRGLRLVPVAGVVLIGLSLFNHYYEPEHAKQDIRSAVMHLNESVRHGDIIIISSVEMGGPFIYYYNQDGIPYVGYPPGMGLVDVDQIGSDMERALNGRQRAWLVLGRTWSSDPQGLIPAYFRARYPLVDDRAYNGVDVKCFRLAN